MSLLSFQSKSQSQVLRGSEKPPQTPPNPPQGLGFSAGDLQSLPLSDFAVCPFTLHWSDRWKYSVAFHGEGSRGSGGAKTLLFGNNTHSVEKTRISFCLF
ncbi:hypothetical protein FKM82_027832 [Ascaphus truei]